MNDLHERRKMLKEVQSLDFAVHDAALFLDVNCKDKKALHYFNHYNALAKQARSKYENQFGPLQYQAQKSDECWEWVDDCNPWPWEYTGGMS